MYLFHAYFKSSWTQLGICYVISEMKSKIRLIQKNQSSKKKEYINSLYGDEDMVFPVSCSCIEHCHNCNNCVGEDSFIQKLIILDVVH